jgi:hypothetical protein
VRCIPCEVAFQTRCHLVYPLHLKKKLGVVAHFREEICKNHMHQNVGTEKQKSPYVQVVNFIPVKVSTLYSI